MPPPPPALEILDVLPDGVVVADASGTVVLTNAVARRFLRLAEDGGVGRQLSDVLVLQDQEACDWYSANDPYGGISTRSGLTEQSWFLPDGTELLVTGRLVRERGGPVTQVALVLRSARGRAQLDRERSDLVATVAHELRSPLTGVKGFVTTLLSKWDRLNDEQKKLMLRTVSADSERLSRLITELLDVARIDTGRLPMYPRELEAAPLLTRVVESVRAGSGRTIDLDLTDDLPPLFADPDKFVQVLTNLVDNAIRHGEGLVKVTAEPMQEPFRGVLITVDDEGEGIPESIRARVFTKFWKHGVRGGTGLGMYIVNGLVRVHAGEVDIEDAPGGGARLLVRWPSADRRTT